MIVKPATGEKALWVTERSQLPSGEWRIMVWLNTTDNGLSHQIHQQVATLVRGLMEEEAERVQLEAEKSGERTALADASPTPPLSGEEQE